MATDAAIGRLNQLIPRFEACGTGRGILEGDLIDQGEGIERALAVEMVALLIAIKERKPEYFDYRVSNWLHRAIASMQWKDSLSWWALMDAAGFQSKHVDKNPMPQDLIEALESARKLAA